MSSENHEHIFKLKEELETAFRASHSLPMQVGEKNFDKLFGNDGHINQYHGNWEYEPEEKPLGKNALLKIYKKYEGESFDWLTHIRSFFIEIATIISSHDFLLKTVYNKVCLALGSECLDFYYQEFQLRNEKGNNQDMQKMKDHAQDTKSQINSILSQSSQTQS